ncbi:hypothetical protein GCM10025874_20500 [Arenivirga flava]|uniref:DUF7507 domain-containing protein n=1 Tax=Arenivirga flava TaxID=1930060 RepID=A0AA37ULT2_9MICO|nr:hypothetical protein [Arenivirga flava]GMA28797.1 hypothetical protein GCM10025874_20500 [Arenivirga flava]
MNVSPAADFVWEGAEGVVLAGESVTATARYTVTQQDVDAGTVVSTLVGIAQPPAGALIDAPAVATVQLSSTSGITIVKTVTPSQNVAAGQVLEYRYVITNAGQLTLRGVAVEDALAGLGPIVFPAGFDGSLAPGASIPATAEYTVTQRDVDTLSVVNTPATASGTDSRGVVVTSAPDDAPATLQAAAPRLTITDAGSLATGARGEAGDVVTWTYVVRNAGNVELRDVRVEEALGTAELAYPAGWTGVLAPGASTTITSSYPLTQGDVESGSVVSVVDAFGTSERGGETTARSTATVPIAQQPTLSIVKTTTATGAPAAGDRIRFDFAVRNTGTVQLNAVRIEDSLQGLEAIDYRWPGAPGVLAPDQTVQASAEYTVTQADVDAGSIRNVATAFGTSGNRVTVDADSEPVVIATQPARPSVAITDSGALQGAARAGQTVLWTYVVSNDGNVTLGTLDVLDRLGGVEAARIQWPTAARTLAPGESVTATGRYVLSQADVDAGAVVSSVGVTALSPTGQGVSDEATASVALAPGASLALVKTGAATGSAGLGDRVEYSFSLLNDGNVTIRGIRLTDAKPGVSTPVVSWPGEDGVLAPGQRATATASYPIGQADVDAGSVTNTATATGSTPANQPVTFASNASEVPLQTRRAAIAVTDDGVLAPGATGRAGDAVQWTYVLTNTGNVTASGLQLTESLGLAPVFGTWPGTPGQLAPGQSVTARATSTLAQADVDRGRIDSRVTATGTGATGGAGTALDAVDTAAVEIAERPSLTITETGGPQGAAVGTDVTFRTVVTNTGNVTVSGLATTNTLGGLGDPTVAWPDPSRPGVLEPGQSVEITAPYRVTQDDLDRGTVANTAGVTGSGPRGTAASAESQQAVVRLASAAPAVEVTGAGDLAPGATGRVGDTVVWNYSLRNSGNVTLRDVALDETIARVGNLVYDWPGVEGVLLPGETVTVTAFSRLTQAQVDAGRIGSNVQGVGTAPGGALTGSDRTTVLLAPQPSLSLLKSGRATGTASADDTIEYRFEVRNTGNVTLSDVAVADALEGLGPISYEWPGAEGVLAPDAVVVGTAVYDLTQADVDRGAVVNTASVQGTTPAGVVTDPVADETTVAVQEGAPAIAVATQGVLDAGGFPRPNDTVTWTYTLENLGNVTLTAAEVAEQLQGVTIVAADWPGAEGELAPGQRVTIVAQSSLTQAQIDSGSITSAITGTSRTPATTAFPQGVLLTERASATLPLTAQPILDLTKAAAPATNAALGDVITYTFTLRNDGNVTLAAARIVDQLAGLGELRYPDGFDGSIAPGAEIVATASYTVTQADVDAGEVRNTATASAVAPNGAVARAASPESVVTTASRTGAIEISDPTGTLAAGARGVAGDLVTWTWTVTNDTSVTLRDVTLAETQLKGMRDFAYEWPVANGVLRPGDSVVVKGTSLLTQAQVDAGSVSSTVRADGLAPDGAPLTSALASATVPVASAGALEIAKTAAVSGAGAVGDTVTFTYELVNRGNVTLTTVLIEDALAGAGAPTFGTWPGAQGQLAPGERVTATSTYTVTQADVDRGSVASDASATARTLQGATPITSNTADAGVALQTAVPRIAVTETGRLDPAGSTPEADGDVRWASTITNTGNVTLTGIALADALGVRDVTFPTGFDATLAPGESVVVTALYDLRQQDLDAGAVVSLVTATGTTTDGATTVSADATATVDLAARPGLELSLVGTAAAGAGVGDVITITYTIRNGGNVTLRELGVADELTGLGPIAFPTGFTSLAPGRTVTATAPYTITQADVDAGQVRHTATANGRTPSGALATSAPAESTTPLDAPDASIKVTDAGALPPGSEGREGENVVWTYVVTNTGATTLTGVSVDDVLGTTPVYSWPGAVGVLAPGQSATVRATAPLTQQQVDAGTVSSVVTASGTSSRGGQVDDDATADVTIAANGALEVEKTGELRGTPSLGGTVEYDFVIRNSGNVTLSGVDLTDPNAAGIVFGAWPGVEGELRPGQQVTASAVHTIVQQDLDDARVRNVATATATEPLGGAVTRDSNESVVSVEPGSPRISVTTSGALETGDRGVAGDTVVWTYTLTNEGGTTLTGVAIADALADVTAPTLSWPDPARPGVLLPGQSLTATATSVVTQAQVNAGTVSNELSGEATTPRGVVLTGAATAPVELLVQRSLGLVKEGSVIGSGRAGDDIEYRFTIENTGTVTVQLLEITDPLPGISEIDYLEWPGEVGLLEPGQTVGAIAGYEITQDDVDRGSVTNRALVTGFAPGAIPVAAESNSLQLAVSAATPSIAVTNRGALAAGERGVAGDTVTWTYTLRNAGNVTLSGVTLADRVAGVGAPTYAWPGAEGVLLPGQQVVATATSTVRQSDVDAGTAQSLVDGVGRTAADVEVSGSAPAAVVLGGTAGIDLVKNAAYLDGGTGRVGDRLGYRYAITNTGDLTLSGVALRDDLAGLGAIAIDWGSAPVGVLAPGATVFATAEHVVTQADVDAGSIASTATATASAVGVSPVSDTAATSITTIAEVATLAVDQRGALAAGATGAAGDTVIWTSTLQNTGTVTLRDVSLAERAAAVGPLTYDWPGEPGVLLPGQTVTVTAYSSVTQAQADAGVIEARITGTGTAQRAGVLTGEDAASVQLAPAASLSILKSGRATGAATADDTIEYRFEVRNTGAVTLSSVAIDDPRISGAIEYDWPAAAGVLAPDAVVVATAVYDLTQADVDRGYVDNTATVSGATPTGGTAGATSGANRVAVQEGNPAIAVDTQGVLDAGGLPQVGDTVTWTYTLANLGNVTLTGVRVDEALQGASVTGIVWPDPQRPGVLEPGQRVVVTAVSTLTQEQIDSGGIRSAITGFATTPASTANPLGVELRENDTAAVPLTAVPAVTLAKSADVTEGVGLGDVITYTFTIANSGNVTVGDLVIADQLAGLGPIALDPAFSGSLAPRASTTATAQYTVAQADLDAGAVRNTATVSVVGAGGAVVGATSNEVVVVTAPDAGSLTIVDERGELAAGGTGVAGDLVTWSYTVVNTSSVTLRDVRLSELALDGMRPFEVVWPGTPGMLAPGQSVLVGGVSALTQAQIDAGSAVSRARADGTAPSGDPVGSAVVSPSVSLAPNAVLELGKSATVSGAAGVGDTVTFTYELVNRGNVSLDAFSIADAAPGFGPIVLGAWPAAQGVLAPGQSVTATTTRLVTQADVDAGVIGSPATASARTPQGAGVPSNEDTGSVVLQAAQPRIAVTDAGRLDPVGAVPVADGDVLWTWTVTNTGNVTLRDVTAAEQFAGVRDVRYPDGFDGVLAPGASVIVSAYSDLAQSDIDAGSIVSFVTATGASARDGAEAQSTATATVPLIERGAIGLAIATATPDGTTVGDSITVSYTITNNGNATLTGLGVTDALPGVSGAVLPDGFTSLAPGASVVATATYTITQADVDAGQVRNLATAQGATPSGATVTSEVVDAVTPLAAPTASIAVTDSGSLPDGAQGRAGENVVWTYVVTNTGAATLSDVTVSDELGTETVITWPGPVGVLAPGQSATVRATAPLTQEQVDAGSVRSVVTASGAPSRGDRVQATDDATVDIARAGGLAVTKSGDLRSASAAVGGVIDYAFTIRNTGNVTLDGVVLTDPNATGIAYGAWPSAQGVLAPGQEVTASAVHRITQADLDANVVANTARVDGAQPDDVVVGADSNEVLVSTEPGSPRITVATTGAVQEGDRGVAGDTVVWTYTLANAGGTTLTAAEIADALAGVGAPTITWPGDEGVLLPGQSLTATATSTITQEQVDAGSITNALSGRATTPAGIVLTGEAQATVELLVERSLSLVKTGTVAAPGGLGDAIEYGFEIENTGTVTVQLLDIADPLAGLSEIAYGAWPGAEGVLLPGETVRASADYAITQDDLDTGSVTNQALVTGIAPGALPVDAESNVLVLDVADGEPALTVTNRGTLPATAEGVTGDTITWTSVLTNTGNVTLRGVTLTDAVAGIGAPSYAWPGAEGVLLPGQSVIVTATSTVSQQDVDAGAASSLVTGRGTTAGGVERTAIAPASVELGGTAEIVLVKTAQFAGTGTGTGEAGDTLRYRFHVSNPGDFTLRGVAIADGLEGLGPIAVEWPGTPGELAPGASAVAFADYTVTQADVDRGSIVNDATVSATPPGGLDPVTSNSSVTTRTAAERPSIAVEQTGGIRAGGVGQVGDLVDYVFTATNTGNVTLRDVQVSPRLADLAVEIVWPDPANPGVLLPGQSVVVRGVHPISQADVDAGLVRSIVDASGVSGTGTRVTDTSSVLDVPTVRSEPSLLVIKDGVLRGPVAAGSTIDYTITVVNDGAVTVRDVEVTDDRLPADALVVGAWPGPEGVLAPGQQVVATASYTVTQADVDAGSVLNVASASGDGPAGPVSADSPTSVVPLSASTDGLRVDKTQSPTVLRAGELITYDYVITNAGVTTLREISLTDGQPGLTRIVITWPGEPGVLEPGQTATAQAFYEVTQADVDRGAIASTVVGSGIDPFGAPEFDAAEGTTVVVEQPALSLDKRGALQLGAPDGPAVRYDFALRNSGNLTLTDVSIDDPLLAGVEVEVAWPGAEGVLAPDEVLLASAVYPVSAADATAGAVVNTATAVGQHRGERVTAEAQATTAIPTTIASIGLTIGVAVQDGRPGYPGDVLQWTYTATNNGTQALRDVDLRDVLADGQELTDGFTVTWPDASRPGVLLPGESVVIVRETVITGEQAGRMVGGSAAVAGTGTATGADATAEATTGIQLPSLPVEPEPSPQPSEPEPSPQPSEPSPQPSEPGASPQPSPSATQGPATPGPVIPGLPWTGADVTLFIVIALLILALGAVLVIVGVVRRRKE